MKKNKKIISFVLLLLSFTLIFADCNFSFSDSNATTCSYISDHFEHSHLHGADDHVIIDVTKSKTSYISFQVDFIFSTDINLISNFISNIWQPPKIS